MSKSNFFHIYLRPRLGVAPKHVETAINAASSDWIRYDDFNWMIYSKLDVLQLNTQLGPLVKPEGNLLVLVLDVRDRSGWMPKAVWEWLREVRND